MFRSFLILCVVALPVFAAERGNGGSIETGIAMGGGPRDVQFLVDQIEWNQRFDPSERIKFTFNNILSFTSLTSSPGTFNNSASYLSVYSLATTQFVLANSQATLDARLGDGVQMSVGHFHTPFGLESSVSRYDSYTYFYSGAYARAQTNRWLWDLGVQLQFSHWLPGELTLALMDGRSATTDPSLAFAARYEFTVDLGKFSLVPSGGLYLGKFAGGGINDTGFSAALQVLAGAFGITGEFLTVRQQTGGSSTSFYAEPSFDFGVAELGIKGELLSNGATSDLNLGIALTKNLPSRLRVRVLFQAAGLQGNIRANQMDFRVLLGTHW